MHYVPYFVAARTWYCWCSQQQCSASRALADFLNNMIVEHSGPVKQFDTKLYVARDSAGAAFWRAYAATIPRHSFLSVTQGLILVQGTACTSIGMLIFNVQENSTEYRGGGVPYFDFFDVNR